MIERISRSADIKPSRTFIDLPAQMPGQAKENPLFKRKLLDLVHGVVTRTDKHLFPVRSRHRQWFEQI